MAKRLRLTAYGVCLDGDRVLLARYVSADATVRHWTLPGGGVEHAEDTVDIGLELARTRPPDGHAVPPEIGGPLRY